MGIISGDTSADKTLQYCPLRQVGETCLHVYIPANNIEHIFQPDLISIACLLIIHKSITKTFMVLQIMCSTLSLTALVMWQYLGAYTADLKLKLWN